MPRRTSAEIVDELNDLLRLAEQPSITLPWPDFYKLCGRERLKQPLLKDVENDAKSRFQLIVAYGNNAVVVCHDRNFAPGKI